MKRLWSRVTKSKRSSVIWLCNAVAVLIFTLSPLLMISPSSAMPAPPSGGGGNMPGGGDITATFLDSSHIGVEATGNLSFEYHDDQGNSFNVTTSIFPMQGVYYGAISQYPSWGGSYGGTQPSSGVNYWFANNQTNPGGSVCSGHNSNIQITSFNAATGDATGNIWIHVPVVDAQSTNQTPVCEPIGTDGDTNGYEIQNIPILNIDTGLGSMKSFSVSTSGGGSCATKDAGNCGPSSATSTYSTLNLPGTASSANFYVNDGSSVYASVYDPSLNATGGAGSPAMYEFTNPTTNSDGSKTYHQGVGGYVPSDCPDALTIPKGETGIFIKGTYSTWVGGGASGCASTDINKPAATYPIMILNETPAAYLSSLTGVATTTGTGGQGGASTSQLVDCTVGGGGIFTTVLNWLLCGAINLAFGTANLLQGWVMKDLQINVASIFDTSTSSGASFYTVWSRFRDIAMGLLVIGALMIIAAKAFGIELFNAHDERKLLSRVPIAIILMSISWPLLTWVYGADNALTRDLPNIVYSAFSGFSATVGAGAGTFATLAAGAVVFTLGPATLTLLLSAILMIGAGLVAVLVRNALLDIFAATICIPIAIAVIPIEFIQKIPKLVRDEGIGLLGVGPVVGLIYPFGQVIGVILIRQGGALGEFSGIIIFVSPGVVVLSVVQQAGKGVGMATGAFQKGRQGIEGRLSGTRQKAAEKNLKNAGNYSRFSDKTALGRGLNTAAGAAFHPVRDARRGRSGVRAGRQAGQATMGAEALKNDPVFAANAHDDSFLYALTAGDKTTKTKIAGHRAEAARATAAGDTATAAKANAAAAALERGMERASAVEGHNSRGVRMAAFGALTQTGYQIADDEDGYKEMSAIATELTGGTNNSGNTGAYQSAMDTAQYNMNQAGRFDTGAANHGAGYDRDAGLDKASTYTAGNAKKQSVASFRKAIESHVTAGKAARDAGDLDGAEVHFTKASRAKQELQSIAQGGKGDVRDAAEKVYRSLGTSAEGNELHTWEQSPGGMDSKGNPVSNEQIAGRWSRSRMPGADDLAGSSTGGSGSGGGSGGGTGGSS